MRRVAGREPRRPAAIVAAILGMVGGIALIGEFRMPLNADAGYHVDAARRMLGEEALYWDLVTPDPPFIFWLSLPIALLGLDGPGTIAAYRVFVLLLIAGAVALAWPALREAPATLAGFLLMAIVLAIGYFGQREHLQYVLTFPYLAFCALRSERGTAGASVCVLAGMVAAYGIALKPTAGLVPALVMVWQVRGARTWRALLVPEHAGIVAGIAVAGAALMLTPQYLNVVAAIREPYAAFSRIPLVELLFRDVHMWSVWLALGAAVLFGRTVKTRRRVAVYTMALIGFFISAALQRKGFGYHYFPAVGCSVILLAELVAGQPRRPDATATIRRIVAALVLMPVLYLFGAVAWRRIGGVVTQTRHDQRVVTRLAGPEPIDLAVLSARMADVYPVVLDHGHRFVLRHPVLWVAGLPRDHAGTEAIRRQYGYDLAEHRPDALIVRTPDVGERRAGDLDTDYLDYLCLDTVARRILAEYRLVERADGFELYRLDAKGAPACASS